MRVRVCVVAESWRLRAFVSSLEVISSHVLQQMLLPRRPVHAVHTREGAPFDRHVVQSLVPLEITFVGRLIRTLRTRKNRAARVHLDVTLQVMSEDRFKVAVRARKRPLSRVSAHVHRQAPLRFTWLRVQSCTQW